MRRLFALLLLAFGCARPPASESPKGPFATGTRGGNPDSQSQPAFTAADARHVLDRFAFGPRPGDVDAVLADGVHTWFEHQLRADELPDPRAERAVLPYRRALAPPDNLPDLYSRGGGVLEAAESGSRWEKSHAIRRQIATKQLLLELQMAEIARHIESDYQLREVMVDFWTNHFTVYARKLEVPLLVGDYVEHVIRPRALGRFEDLLIQTARHPAMLRYLDNASNRARPRQARKGLPGITENYARELLELHTVGIDGGYDQADVIATARILTGWTFRPGADGRGYAFRFERRLHDRNAKIVLGTTFPARGGEEEGLALLHMLAHHPATADHLARKLCVRFVADDPPTECIETTRSAFVASSGDIKVTLRALFGSSSFWAPEARRTKLKTSLEFMISAVRGVDGRLLGTTELARAATRLGEAPFVEPSPKGRSEDSSFWLQSFTLARLGFARDLAFGKLPGVAVDERAALAGGSAPPAITKTLDEALLGGAASPHTRAAIEQTLSQATDDAERSAAGIALVLSSPEFQWR